MNLVIQVFIICFCLFQELSPGIIYKSCQASAAGNLLTVEGQIIISFVKVNIEPYPYIFFFPQIIRKVFPFRFS